MGNRSSAKKEEPRPQQQNPLLRLGVDPSSSPVVYRAPSDAPPGAQAWYASKQGGGYLATGHGQRRVEGVTDAMRGVLPCDLVGLVCSFLAPCSLNSFLDRFQVAREDRTASGWYRGAREEVEGRIMGRVSRAFDAFVAQVPPDDVKSLLTLQRSVPSRLRDYEWGDEVGGLLRQLLKAVFWHRFGAILHADSYPPMPGEVLGQLQSGHYFFAKDPCPAFFGGCTHSHFLFLIASTLPELLERMHAEDREAYDSMQEVWEPVSVERCEEEHQGKKVDARRRYCQCERDRKWMRVIDDTFGAEDAPRAKLRGVIWSSLR